MTYGVEFLKKEMSSQVQQNRLNCIAQNTVGKKILDVGGGVGMTLDKFDPQDKTLKTIDNELHFVKYMKEKGYDAELGDITKMKFKDKEFDSVIAAEIIEHLPNPGEGMAECFRTSNDQVLFTIPKNNAWEEHSWVFNWIDIGPWLVVSARRNPKFQGVSETAFNKEKQK